MKWYDSIWIHISSLCTPKLTRKGGTSVNLAKWNSHYMPVIYVGLSMVHLTIQILACLGLCWGSHQLTNVFDKGMIWTEGSHWTKFVDTTWLRATHMCTLRATGPWNFLLCFKQTASRTRGYGPICHHRACHGEICGSLSTDIFTTTLLRGKYCRHRQRLIIIIHNSVHLNLTILFDGFYTSFDTLTVKGGDKEFGPYSEEREPMSLFIKSFMAEISYEIVGKPGNDNAFQLIYQPSAIRELTSYQLFPFKCAIAHDRWWLATYSVAIDRLYRIKLHFNNLSCHLLRELVVFDGPGLMSGVVNTYKFNPSNNSNVSCNNYTIIATTFQVYIAWMSLESPDILGTIDYENSQPTHRIDIDGEHQSRIHFVRNEASLADVTAWQYVYNIKCAINRRVQLNMYKVQMKGLSDSQCHYGGMAVYNIDNNNLKLVALWCESINHLEKYPGILNLTSTENMFITVLYGYKMYFEMEVQFDVSFTECVGLFFGMSPTMHPYAHAKEYEGSINVRIQVPCLDCMVFQFICLPFEPYKKLLEYTMIWESSLCIRDGAAVVNITNFPPPTFFGHYAFRGLYYRIAETPYSEEFYHTTIVGGSLEVITSLDRRSRQQINIVLFRNSPCLFPCKTLPLTNDNLIDLEGSGQSLCDVCTTYIVSHSVDLQPTYNTCMEIRTKGTNCKDIRLRLGIGFSHYYSIDISYDGNIDLFFNDMYTDFRINTDVPNTKCLTFVTFSNSLVEYRTLSFDAQFVYERGRFASYTGSQKTWWEIEHFCVAQGQRMVTVNNLEEQYELVQFAKKHMVQKGVPLGIWRDVGINVKCA